MGYFNFLKELLHGFPRAPIPWKIFGVVEIPVTVCMGYFMFESLIGGIAFGLTLYFAVTFWVYLICKKGS